MLICISRRTVVFAVIALHTLLFADQIYAAPKASRFTVGVGLASDGFGQGTSSTTSELLFLNAEWTNRGKFERLVENKNYYSIDFSINYEPMAENYDADRVELSNEFSATYQRPLKRIGPSSYASFVAGAEIHHNAQQTEEFEKTFYSGLAIDKYFSVYRTAVNITALGALACNEEEKDDERPRMLLGLGRDALNRKGCGFYSLLKSTTLRPSGLIWFLSFDNYTGDYGTKHYRKQRVSTNVRWPINDNNSCDASFRLIRRNSERNLIGIDDNFYQFSVGCSHHF